MDLTVCPSLGELRTYTVSPRARRPPIDFILESLRVCNCRVIRSSGPNHAPFQVTFETPTGERLGIVAYAFLANSKTTKNRTEDEHRFQIKYGNKDGALHEIWQDPFGLYTTLFFGINPDDGFFVGIDPVLHSPTRMFISFEFKEEQTQRVLADGWHCWERQKTTRGLASPVETVVGGIPSRFLDYIRFEQAALRLDQGHRFLLAEQFGNMRAQAASLGSLPPLALMSPQERDAHRLAKEFELDPDEILSLIDAAPRLKMAVRGWVAERHLEDELLATTRLREVTRIEEDGQPDFDISVNNGKRLRIECKNVLRKPMADGTIREWISKRLEPPKPIPVLDTTAKTTSRSSPPACTPRRRNGNSAIA